MVLFRRLQTNKQYIFTSFSSPLFVSLSTFGTTDCPNGRNGLL